MSNTLELSSVGSEELVDKLPQLDPSTSGLERDHNAFVVAGSEDIQFIDLHELLLRPTPRRDMILEPILERRLSTMISAAPGVGKTTLVVELAFAAAAGVDFGPFKAVGRAKVIYVNLEDTLTEITRRFEAVAKHFIGGEDAMRQVQVLHREGSLRIIERGGESVGFTRLGQRLKDAILASQPDLIVIDPLALAHDLDENLNSEMAALMERLETIPREADAAMLIVHHSKKDSDRGSGLDSVRGASAIGACVRSVWRLVDADSSTVALTCTKANNFEKPAHATYLRKISVEIASGDSVGVLVPLDGPPESAEIDERGTRGRKARGAPGSKSR